jgi:prophage regulatory protein
MRLLTFPELRERGIPYTRQHLDRKMRAGEFPGKIHLSPARIGWAEDEIDSWLRSKAAARPAKILETTY